MKKIAIDLPALTGLRGFAALWVCLFHYTYANDFGPLTPIAHSGSTGVVIFFILSGFIMAHVYGQAFADRSIGFVRFMWHRIARVYPLYIFALCAVALLMAYGIMPYGPRDTVKTFMLNLAMMQSWGLINEITWVGQSWSISTEFACYLLFPLAAGYLFRRSALWSAVAIGLLFVLWYENSVIVAIQALLHSLGKPYEGVTFLYGFSLSSFVMTFGSGALLCNVARWMRDRFPAWAFDVVTAAGVAWLLQTSWHEFNQLTAAGSTMLILLGLSSNAGAGRALFGNIVSEWLGKVSYALYLAHVALIHIWVYFLGIYMPGFWFHQVPLSIRLGVALFVAAVLHYGFELPARKLLRSLAAPKQSSISVGAAHE